MKRVIIASTMIEHTPSAVSTSPTLSTPVTADRHPHHDHLQSVFLAPPDDSDEHVGSRKLRLSEPRDLPSNEPMTADANLSSDDVRVECVLERFEQDHVANKLSDPVLSRVAGETSDVQFLEVVGLDNPARERIT